MPLVTSDARGDSIATGGKSPRMPCRRGGGTVGAGSSWRHRLGAARREPADELQAASGTVRTREARRGRRHRLNFGHRRVRLRSGVDGGSAQALLHSDPGGLSGGRPEPVVAHLVKAGRQDVLEKAAKELFARERHAPPRVRRGILVREGDRLGRDGEDASIGDRDPMDVAGEVAKDARVPLDRRFAVDHPRRLPDAGRDRYAGQARAYTREKAGAEVNRQRTDGDEEVLARRAPAHTVRGEGARGHQQWTWGW